MRKITDAIYRNELNRVGLHNFNAKEMNALFCLISRLDKKGDVEVTYKLSTLAKITHLDHLSIDKFCAILTSVKEKLNACYIYEHRKKPFRFEFFQKFEIHPENNTLTMRINPEYIYMVNNFSEKKGYTKVPLDTFMSIKGKYAKTLYRFICQFHNTGYIELEIDDCRKIFDIPEKTMNNYIKRDIFGRAIKEIKKNTNNLYGDIKCEARHNRRLKGQPVTGYKFTWTISNEIRVLEIL